MSWTRRGRSALRLVAVAAGGLAVSLILAMLITGMVLLLLGALFIGFGNAFVIFVRLFVASGVVWLVAAAAVVAGVASLASPRRRLDFE